MTTAPRALRRTGSLLLLAVLSVITMFAVSRCKYGPDKVTGIDHNTNSPAGQCIHDCVDAYQDSLKAEDKLHKKNLQACRGDGGGHGDDGGDNDDSAFIDPSGVLHDGGDDGDHHPTNPCTIAENQRHRDAIQRIARGLRDCISGCHHQGAGGGH